MPAVGFTPRIAFSADLPPDGDKGAADLPAAARPSPGIMTTSTMIPPLKNDPLLDAVRADPRFEELIRRAAARLESKS